MSRGHNRYWLTSAVVLIVTFFILWDNWRSTEVRLHSDDKEMKKETHFPFQMPSGQSSRRSYSTGSWSNWTRSYNHQTMTEMQTKDHLLHHILIITLYTIIHWGSFDGAYSWNPSLTCNMPSSGPVGNSSKTIGGPAAHTCVQVTYCHLFHTAVRWCHWCLFVHPSLEVVPSVNLWVNPFVDPSSYSSCIDLSLMSHNKVHISLVNGKYQNYHCFDPILIIFPTQPSSDATLQGEGFSGCCLAFQVYAQPKK